MEKEEISQYMSELGKRSVKKRKEREGENFNENMRKVANARWAKERDKKDLTNASGLDYNVDTLALNREKSKVD